MTTNQVDWAHWRLIPFVSAKEAAALSLGIDPGLIDSLTGTAVTYQKRVKVIVAQPFETFRCDINRGTIHLSDFAAWAARAEWDIPPELAALCKGAAKPGPAIPSDNKLLETIAALLAAWPGGAKQWPSGKDLEKAADLVGVSITDDTIRKALKAARALAPSMPPA